MQELVVEQYQYILYFILMTIVVVVGVQTSLLLRMRNILQALAMNSDTLVHYVRKAASTDKKTRPDEHISKSCQFCKHRLAYIHTPKSPNAQEDFYYKCELRNISISLDDSCPLFEEDKDTFH